MNFEYGKITDLKEDERGYISISINQNLAFRKVSRKFNVWDVEYLKKQMGVHYKLIPVLDIKL